MGWREKVDKAHKRLILGEPGGLGIKSLIKYKSHLSKLEREAPFAIIATNIAAESGLDPLKSFEILESVDSLPASSFEAKRIKRDCIIYARYPSEQLREEIKEARGLWKKLLSTIVSVEASGLDPRLLFKDLRNLVLSDLRADYDRLANRFKSLVSMASVLFGAMPMMVATILALFASSNIVPLMLAMIVANAVIAGLWMMSVDFQVPDTADYSGFYKASLVKWLLIGVAVGLATYFSWIITPFTLTLRSTASLCLGMLAFALPFTLDWRRQARVFNELLDDLHLVLRDIAEQVDREFSPHQAVENIYSVGGYGRYTMRLISLLVKEARVSGSLRDAYGKIRELLPKPWRISLELISLIEEMGAGSSAVHALSDAMGEYMIALREFKRGIRGYKWLAIFMTLLTLFLLIFLSNTVMPKFVQIGLILEENPGMFTMPIQPPRPEELPAIKDVIYLMVAANSIALSFVIGKTSGWTLGEGVKEALKTCMIILAVVLGAFYLL